MAQENRPSPNAAQKPSGSTRGKEKNDGADTDRAPVADLGANSGADFQVSLATATSIASLTAYATPHVSKASYVSDEEIGSDMGPPLAYKPSDRAFYLPPSWPPSSCPRPWA